MSQSAVLDDIGGRRILEGRVLMPEQPPDSEIAVLEPVTPQTKGKSDRGADGRFLPGHSLPGPGNPSIRAMTQWREMFIAAVTPRDMFDVVKALVAHAKEGQPWAINELLNRCKCSPAENPSVTGVPAGAGAVTINVALGTLLADRVQELSRLPPAPGLRALGAAEYGRDTEAGSGSGSE